MSSSYTVRPHDTLSSIARLHGCTVQALQSANGISDPRKLAAGSTILIPQAREYPLTKRQAESSARPSMNRSPLAAGHGQTEKASSINHFLHELWQDADQLMTGLGASVMGVRLGHGLAGNLLSWYRELESTEVVHTDTWSQIEQRKAGERKRTQVKRPGASAAKKHKDEVLTKLHERLYAVPHVVTTQGVRLSRNERRMIAAAVGLCEVNNDVFGAENPDTEFVGRRFGANGAKTKYSNIVHIGLSYGYIQFTQDSGSLGRLLTRMREKNKRLFDEKFFPNADQLIELTTIGLPGSDQYGKSGQAYWTKLSKKKRDDLILRVSEDADHDKRPDNPLTLAEEIRGARVQPIPYVPGGSAMDIWQNGQQRDRLPGGDLAPHMGYLAAFLAAGDMPIFQDVQLELAVEDYLNPILSHCTEWNIRSAVGLAFVTACSVRGGPSGGLTKLLSKVATNKLNIEKFESAQQERECLLTIASRNQVRDVELSPTESLRATILLADEYKFLTENLYDPATYNSASDF